MQTTPRQTELSSTPSSVEFYWVNPWDIPGVWKEVSPILQRALEHNNEESGLEDIWKRLIRNEMILWIAVQDSKFIGCVCTEVIFNDRCRTLFVRLLAGEMFHLWAKFEKDLIEYAKQVNCQGIETNVIPSVGRLARKYLEGYEVTHHVMRKTL